MDRLLKAMGDPLAPRVGRILAPRLEPTKTKRAAETNVGLGVLTDLSRVSSHGEVVFRAAPGRVDEVLAWMRQVRKREELTAAEAAVWVGKISFLLTSVYGRVGNAALQPLRMRAGDRGDKRLTPEIEASLEFLGTLLPRLPALVSGLVEDETPPLLLYTDAAFSRGRRLGRRWCEQACGADARAPNTYTARMAFVVADPVDGWKAFSDAPPAWEDVSFLAPDKETYISQMEAMAVVAAFYSLASSHPERLRGRRVNAFIDNTAALSALVHGYTGKEDLAKISNAYHLQLASLRAAAYLEFVPSEANIADLPSRRKYELMRLLGIQPLEFHMPRMSDWSSPLVEWLRRFNSTGPSWQV